MRKIPATLVAMLAGWLLMIGGYAVCGAVTGMRSFEIVGVAAATGAVCGVAWLVVVLPVITWWGHRRLFSDVRWSWLGWMGMACLTHAPIAILLGGFEALSGSWFPAGLGAIAGLVFAALTRRSRADPEQPARATVPISNRE